MNIISTLSGATIQVASIGHRLHLVLTGEPEQVTQAANLLYNFHAVSDTIDYSTSCVEFVVNRKHFLRGLLALCMYHATGERNNATGRIAGGKAKCVQAIVNAAHSFRAMLASGYSDTMERNEHDRANYMDALAS